MGSVFHPEEHSQDLGLDTQYQNLIFLFLGLAALVACSWIGHQIVTDFYNPLTPMNIK